MMMRNMLSPILEKRQSKKVAIPDTNTVTNHEVLAAELPYGTTASKFGPNRGRAVSPSVDQEPNDADDADEVGSPNSKNAQPSKVLGSNGMLKNKARVHSPESSETSEEEEDKIDGSKQAPPPTVKSHDGTTFLSLSSSDAAAVRNDRTVTTTTSSIASENDSSSVGGDFSVALSSDDEGRLLTGWGGGDNIDSSFRSNLSSDDDSYVKDKVKGKASMMMFAKGKAGLMDSSSVRSNMSFDVDRLHDIHLPVKQGSGGGILYGLPDCSIRGKIELSKLDVSARSTGLESIESPLDSSMCHVNSKYRHGGHYQKGGAIDSSCRSTLSSDDSKTEKIYPTFTNKKIGGSLDVSARSAYSVESMHNEGSVDYSIPTSPHDSGLLYGLPECSIRAKVETSKIDFSIRSTRSCGGESVDSTFNPDSERYIPIHPPAFHHRAK